jgi:hypothetical protein
MFDEMNLFAGRIIKWLRQHGENEVGESECRHITLHDEPWEEFSAELQAWGDGNERLFVGYYFRQNGDLVPDPNIVLDLHEGKVVGGLIDTQFASLRLRDAEPDDLHYVEQFLMLVWNRHLKGRKAVQQ